MHVHFFEKVDNTPGSALIDAHIHALFDYFHYVNTNACMHAYMLLG